jgi:hypothetical protein
MSGLRNEWRKSLWVTVRMTTFSDRQLSFLAVFVIWRFDFAAKNLLKMSEFCCRKYFSLCNNWLWQNLDLTSWLQICCYPFSFVRLRVVDALSRNRGRLKKWRDLQKKIVRCSHDATTLVKLTFVRITFSIWALDRITLARKTSIRMTLSRTIYKLFTAEEL